MKKGLKALLLVMCAIVLVVATVFTTLAFMTSQKTITNTFTVGSIAITLDETDVDVMGEKDGESRVTENTYKLIPGRQYTKDPVIHVDKNSESAYLYVKVVNQISSIEDDGNTIAAQMAEKGWTALDGVDNVYCKTTPFVATAQPTGTENDVAIFDTFKIANNANVSTYEGNTIQITAYAIQSDGFDTAKKAWDAAIANNDITNV